MHIEDLINLDTSKAGKKRSYEMLKEAKEEKLINLEAEIITAKDNLEMKNVEIEIKRTSRFRDEEGLAILKEEIEIIIKDYAEKSPIWHKKHNILSAEIDALKKLLSN